MIRTTPFHARLSELNTQGLYTHWQGHLSALRYSHAPKHEYFAVRNGVGVFDTSPLFKYRIQGPDAERFLAGVLALSRISRVTVALESGHGAGPALLAAAKMTAHAETCLLFDQWRGDPLADLAGGESPWVSPDNPRTEEPPRDRS